jgi:HEAT repeat protein
MKRITLSTFLLTCAGIAVFAGDTASTAAQTPPAPPPASTPRVRPTPPPPAPRTIVTPRALDDLGFEEMRASTAFERDFARMDREMAVAARAAAAVDAMPIMPEMPEMPIMPAIAAMTPMPPMTPMALYDADRFERRLPPAAWAQGDPADSLYRTAREVLNRGDWGRAARMFQDIQRNYPKSVYEKEAVYWEAWSRYKIGTTDELKQAAKVLEPTVSRLSPGTDDNPSGMRRYAFRDGQRASDSDVLSLYTRINGVLAQRGDADAASKVAKFAQQQGAPCDQEDLQVRAEALSALTQMDPTQAVPMLRRVLDRKDDCSASLRRNAVLILSRRTDADATALLLQTAKSDPNISVRSDAVSYLSRIPGDAGVNALEEILKTEQDERIQRAAIRGLMASDNPRARASMRSLLDRRDAPLNLRIEALSSYNSERATADDAAYLRSLYGRADNDRLKTEIVNAIARVGGQENDQFLLNLVRNNNEPSSARSAALSRLSRSSTLSTADLSKLYDASAESYDIRSRIISILGNRKDQESTDKLIDIVKNSTVLNHRTQAINALVNKKDPRATQALMDVLDGKKS